MLRSSLWRRWCYSFFTWMYSDSESHLVFLQYPQHEQSSAIIQLKSAKRTSASSFNAAHFPSSSTPTTRSSIHHNPRDITRNEPAADSYSPALTDPFENHTNVAGPPSSARETRITAWRPRVDEISSCSRCREARSSLYHPILP